MGAAARNEETGKFVGQVLGRATPILEFRSSQKPLPIDPHGAGAASDAEADAPGAPHREPAESEVRLSRKPTLRLPVVPRLVRHTRLDLKLFAPRAEPSRALRRLAHAAVSLAAVLVLLALAAVVTRAVPGDRVAARASIALRDDARAHAATPRAEKSTFEHKRTLDEGPGDRLIQLTQEEEDLTVPAEAAVTMHASTARVTPSHAHPRTPRVAPRHRAHAAAPAKAARAASHAKPAKR